jgi:hypothetical protein
MAVAGLRAIRALRLLRLLTVIPAMQRFLVVLGNTFVLSISFFVMVFFTCEGGGWGAALGGWVGVRMCAFLCAVSAMRFVQHPNPGMESALNLNQEEIRKIETFLIQL